MFFIALSRRIGARGNRSRLKFPSFYNKLKLFGNIPPEKRDKGQLRAYSSANGGESVRRVTLTSSVWLDLLLIVSFLIFLISTSYFLRVYYHVTVTDIEIVYTSTEGTITDLRTPVGFKKNGLAASSPDEMLEDLEGKINKYMQTSGWYFNYLYKRPKARIDWTINYSYSSADLKRKKIISFDHDSKF